MGGGMCRIDEVCPEDREGMRTFKALLKEYEESLDIDLGRDGSLLCYRRLQSITLFSYITLRLKDRNPIERKYNQGAPCRECKERYRRRHYHPLPENDLTVDHGYQEHLDNPQ